MLDLDHVEFSVLAAHCRICAVRLDCCSGFVDEAARDAAMAMFISQHRAHSLVYDVVVHVPGYNDSRAELEMLSTVQ